MFFEEGIGVKLVLKLYTSEIALFLGTFIILKYIILLLHEYNVIWARLKETRVY